MNKKQIFLLSAGITAVALMLAVFILWFAFHHSRSEPKTLEEIATEMEQITESATEENHPNEGTTEAEKETCIIYNLCYLYYYLEDEDM